MCNKIMLTNNWAIGLSSRVFANGPGDWGSIPGQVIPKTQKMVLDAALLNTQHYKVCIKCKWSNPGNGVAPYPTILCSNYRKGSLQVTLDQGCQLYLQFKTKDIILHWPDFLTKVAQKYLPNFQYKIHVSIWW